jgi:dolichol-phosphate mannosyltransferase
MEEIKNKKISIILSTFNEEIAIEKTINEIQKYIKNVEIIVVDDNSTDKTFEILKRLQNQNIKIFLRKKNKGLASAFLLGLINTQGDIIGWVDSNMTSIVKIFPEMIHNLENNDIVILSRFVDGGKDERNMIRKWSSYILNKFTKFVLNSKINDLSSGIFVMNKKVLLDTLPIASGHGEFMIEFLYNAERRGNKIKEISYTQPMDEEGNSKSYPNIFKFSLLGFFYFIRILQIFIRR